MPKTADTDARYYFLLPNGEQEGPYSLRELREMLARDLISAEAQVRSTECGCPLHLDELLHETQTNTIDEITGLNGLRGGPSGISLPMYSAATTATRSWKFSAAAPMPPPRRCTQ